MKVEPIREESKIKEIKRLLKSNVRDYCLFICGINNGLRGGDLLNLKVKDVMNKKEGDKVRIIEEKTGKENYFYLNKSCYKSIQKLIDEYHLSADKYLFPSRKGKGLTRIDTYTLNRLVKSWCSMVNLKGSYGSHTLRKTFGYIQRVKYGVSWELISERLNHSSPKQTRVYLGIDKSEIVKMMSNEI